MQGKTHTLAGIAVGLAFAYYAKGEGLIPASDTLELYGLSLVCSVAGALLPDIDLQTSKIGGKTRPLSSVIQGIFGHRTLFHAPDVYTALYIMARWRWPLFWYWITQAFAGIVSHLFLDLYNKQGIPLFYPYPKRYHIASLKLGGVGEKLIQGCLSIFIVFFLLYISEMF